MISCFLCAFACVYVLRFSIMQVTSSAENLFLTPQISTSRNIQCLQTKFFLKQLLKIFVSLLEKRLNFILFHPKSFRLLVVCGRDVCCVQFSTIALSNWCTLTCCFCSALCCCSALILLFRLDVSLFVFFFLFFVLFFFSSLSIFFSVLFFVFLLLLLWWLWWFCYLFPVLGNRTKKYKIRTNLH